MRCDGYETFGGEQWVTIVGSEGVILPETAETHGTSTTVSIIALPTPSALPQPTLDNAAALLFGCVEPPTAPSLDSSSMYRRLRGGWTRECAELPPTLAVCARVTVIPTYLLPLVRERLTV